MCETKSQQFPHCGVEKQEILSHQKNISSNQLFSNLFSKTVTAKSAWEIILVISTLWLCREKLWQIISSNQLFSNLFCIYVAFTEFLRKKRMRKNFRNIHWHTKNEKFTLT